jgi:hypothetical protein
LVATCVPACAVAVTVTRSERWSFSERRAAEASLIETLTAAPDVAL